MSCRWILNNILYRFVSYKLYLNGVFHNCHLLCVFELLYMISNILFRAVKEWLLNTLK